MNCSESPVRLLEYLDANAVLSTADRAAIAAHLAGCPTCQATARNWQSMEAALGRMLQPPTLPVDFVARLQQRIAAETRPMSFEEVACKKQQLQAEYEAGLARLRNRRSALPPLDPTTKLMAALGVVLPALAALAAKGFISLPPTIGPVNTSLACFAAAGIGIAMAAWLPKLRPAWQRWF